MFQGDRLRVGLAQQMVHSSLRVEDPHTRGTFLEGVPREQKMLEGHLPRVIYHRVYLVYNRNLLSRKGPVFQVGCVVAPNLIASLAWTWLYHSTQPRPEVPKWCYAMSCFPLKGQRICAAHPRPEIAK